MGRALTEGEADALVECVTTGTPPAASDAMHAVWMSETHFNAYVKWLAEHHLDAPMLPRELWPGDDHDQANVTHHFVGIMDSHPDLRTGASAPGREA